MTTQPQDPAAAEATDEETTAPTTEPEAGETPLRTRIPGWTRPPSIETGLGDSSDAGDDSPASSDELPEPKSSRTGGSRTSSRASSKKQLRKAIAVGFSGLTGLAHEYLVRDEYAQRVGLLLADEGEPEEVAEPAANIVARRMKDAPIPDDVADGMALVIAVAGYLLRQLGVWQYARQLRLEQAVIGDGLQPDYTHDQAGADGDDAKGDPAA